MNTKFLSILLAIVFPTTITFAQDNRILSFKEAKKFADLGDAQAQAIVAMHYQLGWQTEKNPELAFKYARSSAQKGHPMGSFRLGSILRIGEGVAKNEVLGVDLQKRSFDGLNKMPGNPYAITALGVMLFQGKAVRANKKEAARLYKIAADMGFAPAQFNLAQCIKAGYFVAQQGMEEWKYLIKSGLNSYPESLIKDNLPREISINLENLGNPAGKSLDEKISLVLQKIPSAVDFIDVDPDNRRLGILCGGNLFYLYELPSGRLLNSVELKDTADKFFFTKNDILFLCDSGVNNTKVVTIDEFSLNKKSEKNFTGTILGYNKKMNEILLITKNKLQLINLINGEATAEWFKNSLTKESPIWEPETLPIPTERIAIWGIQNKIYIFSFTIHPDFGDGFVPSILVISGDKLFEIKEPSEIAEVINSEFTLDNDFKLTEATNISSTSGNDLHTFGIRVKQGDHFFDLENSLQFTHSPNMLVNVKHSMINKSPTFLWLGQSQKKIFSLPNPNEKQLDCIQSISGSQIFWWKVNDGDSLQSESSLFKFSKSKQPTIFSLDSLNAKNLSIDAFAIWNLAYDQDEDLFYFLGSDDKDFSMLETNESAHSVRIFAEIRPFTYNPKTQTTLRSAPLDSILIYRVLTEFESGVDIFNVLDSTSLVHKNSPLQNLNADYEFLYEKEKGRYNVTKNIHKDNKWGFVNFSPYDNNYNQWRYVYHLRSDRYADTFLNCPITKGKSNNPYILRGEIDTAVSLNESEVLLSKPEGICIFNKQTGSVFSSWLENGVFFPNANRNRTAVDIQARRVFRVDSDFNIRIFKINQKTCLEELATIIPQNNNKQIISVDGKFYASTSLDSSGIHFSDGKKTYPFEQFDLRLNRPDIVLERLGAPDEAIAIAKQLREKRLKRMGVTEDMLQPDFHLPEIEIVGDLPSTTADSELALKIKATDSKYPLDRLRVYLNNVPVNGREGELLRDAKSQTLERIIPVKLAAGRNKIQVSVLNSAGAESLYGNAEVTCAAQRPKPTLYAVAMGVSEYANPEWNLKYAAKDARDILERVKSRSGSIYGEIKELLLTDRDATKESLGKIREFLSKATVDDTVLMFVAGHGLLDSKYDYYFGTSDIDFDNPSAKGIAFGEFDDLLADLPCLRKSLLVDTCHAGELDEDEKKNLASAAGLPAPLPLVQGVAMRSVGKRGMTIKPTEGARGKSEWYDRLQSLFVDLRRGSGSTILSSSAGAEYSLESSEQKNGLFTYAVLEALDGKKSSDTNKDGSVTMSELADYVKTRVAALTNNKQSPNVRRVNLEGDFTLSKK